MWNKGEPKLKGDYLVALQTNVREEPFITVHGWDGHKWNAPSDWEVLGWMPIPEWNDNHLDSGYHYTVHHATSMDTVGYETDNIDSALHIVEMIDLYAIEGEYKITIKRSAE